VIPCAVLFDRSVSVLGMKASELLTRVVLHGAERDERGAIFRIFHAFMLASAVAQDCCIVVFYIYESILISFSSHHEESPAF
jgi:hypothetical protein